MNFGGVWGTQFSQNTTHSEIQSAGLRLVHVCAQSLSRAQLVKNLPADAGDVGLIPESEISPEVGNDNLLQYSCLENSMDREAWQATK